MESIIVYLILLVIFVGANLFIKWRELQRTEYTSRRRKMTGLFFISFALIFLILFLYYAISMRLEVDMFRIVSAVFALLIFLVSGLMYRKEHDITLTASVFYLFLYPAFAAIVVLTMQDYLHVIQMVTVLQIPITILTIWEYRKRLKSN